MKYLASILLITFFVSTANSQVDILFDKINLDAQSDISIVSSIAQDKYGYVWAATEEGILKYNSHNAYVYNEYNGLPESFSNKIQKIYVDYNNTIWAASDNHLAQYDQQSNSFIEINLPDNISIIYDIVVQGERLWLGSYNGLWSLPINSPEEGELMLKDKVISFLYDASNEMYIGSKSGLYKRGQNGRIDVVNENLIISSALMCNHGLLVGSFDGELSLLDKGGNINKTIIDTGTPIYDILYSFQDDKYFVGCDGEGLYVLGGDLNVISHEVQNVNDMNSLSSNGIYDLHADNSGQIWIATYGGGINKFKSGGNPFTDVSHIANKKQSIANSFTRAIVETAEGNIWYGTKEGLSIYNPKNERWQHKPSMADKSNSSDIIMSLAEDGDYVWVGTYGNGVYKVDKSNLKGIEYNSRQSGPRKISLDRVYSICKVSDGTIYLGGIGAPLHYIKGTEIGTIPISQIRDIVQGPGGQIFTVGKSGVNLIKGDKPILQESLYFQDTEFDYSTINCATFENEKIIWIGTNGDGLIRYNIDNQEYRIINMSDGLPSDIIQGIILLNQRLWASTSRGIISFDLKDDSPQIDIYEKGDGIKNISFNYGSYERLNDGRLAFGSTDGVIFLDPSKLNKRENAPDVFLEKISILNTTEGLVDNSRNLHAEQREKIKLSYKENFVRVDYSGIDYEYPDKVRYSWLMEGVNSSWSSPTKEHNVTFAGLRSGDYTFNVRAIDRNGNQGKIASMDIQITPPWWASSLAYIIYALLGIGLIVGGLVIARALLTKRNAEEQISFYNNITHELKTPLSILLTKLENVSDTNGSLGEVKTTVKRMNNLFDQLLNFNKVSSDYYRDQVVSKITFAKHVNLVADTFRQAMEKKNISFTFNNDWPYEHFYYKRDVLDKITYNLISNAIKYSNKGGAVILSAEEYKDRLRLTVKDNGIGIPKDQQADILKRYYRARNAINSQTPGTGLGLMIVKNLAEYDGGEILFTSEEGLGSAFTVILPSLESKYIAPKVINDVPDPALEPIPNTSQQSKILVVEDNDELRIDLVEKLSEHYSIVAARDGKEGFEKAKSKIPDLIITDLIMPEMDGNELCLALQKDEDTTHIPVFMMTVLNSSTQKVESIKSGITSYMTKPIDFPFLIAKINSVLDYKQKLREKYLHEAEVETSHKFKDKREEEFVQRMEDFIIEKIKEENISVQDLCKHIGMSRTALYMKTKEMLDMSLQNFIITTKMNHARKLLLQGGVTVKEVAYQVGFANPKYFSTSFKKQFGESPSGFLKSLNPI